MTTSQKAYIALVKRPIGFLDTALGSAYEVDTQLLIAKNIGYISDDIYNNLLNADVEIQKQLVGLINSIRK